MACSSTNMTFTILVDKWDIIKASFLNNYLPNPQIHPSTPSSQTRGKNYAKEENNLFTSKYGPLEKLQTSAKIKRIEANLVLLSIAAAMFLSLC